MPTVWPQLLLSPAVLNNLWINLPQTPVANLSFYHRSCSHLSNQWQTTYIYIYLLMPTVRPQLLSSFLFTLIQPVAHYI